MGLTLLLTGCDCPREVKGLVVDYHSDIEISDVLIWEDSRSQKAFKSDLIGGFDYNDISGGLLGCPDVNLTFTKSGYVQTSQTFEAYSSDTVIVRLTKDFDLSEIRAQVLDSVIQVEKANYVSSGSVGDGAVTPDLWYTRQWIIKQATPEELLILLNYPNSAVRATAFEGLYDRKYNDIYDLLVDIIDTSNHDLHYVSGCLGYDLTLGEHLYQNVLQYSVDDAIAPPPLTNRKVELTDEQRQIISNKLTKNINRG